MEIKRQIEVIAGILTLVLAGFSIYAMFLYNNLILLRCITSLALILMGMNLIYPWRIFGGGAI